MKKLFIILLLPFSMFCQVGINTTTPTNTLDVNGSVRVRSLTNGTVESSTTGVLATVPYKVIAMGVVARNGTLIKGFGATSVNISNGLYRITFNVPELNNDYIIMLTARNKSANYKNPTLTNFEVVIENYNNGGTFDFNFVVYRMTN